MASADDLFDLVYDDIAAALLVDDHSMRMSALRAAGEEIFRLAYDDVPGDPRGVERSVMEFLNVLNAAMAHTIPDGSDEQIERIARIWATAAANAAVYYSDPHGDKTWRTMQDDRVRELHVPMHDVTVAAGESFNVGGVPMRYPGEPVGPPDHWIGCRCHLTTGAVSAAAQGGDVAETKEVPKGEMPSADEECPDGQHLDEETGECVDDEPGDELAMEPGETADGLTARSFDTAKRKAMAKRHTAMPDGSFPIANAEDLRNAIQAIGRAKDPDKVKAHIRRRAKALGLTSLIPESWTASAEPDAVTAARGRPSPPGTHDAPGWLTHPRETQRLRTYWTKGEGALKIRWGQGGDFDRCRRQLRKYVHDPEYLAGTCANLHFVALGFWPGQGPHAGRRTAKRAIPAAGDQFIDTEEFEAVTAAFIAAAELDDELPPVEWFQPPPLTAATPVTITDDDEFTAHLATWDTCHVGISGGCTTPPHSAHEYAYFRTGEMLTAGGPVPVGQITMDTGHADTDLGPNATVAHYDNTGTVVADVAAGEDEHGIWVHGMLRPGLSPEQRRALRAGSLSGDWRRIGGNLELVAALVVNVPGFPVPRPQLAASAGIETALVAAAPVIIDPNALNVDRIAIAIVDRLAENERHRSAEARVAALRTAVNGERVAALVAAVEVD